MTIRTVQFFRIVACVGILCVAHAARADVTTSNPNLPPDTGAYLTPDNVHALYHGPGLTVILQRAEHKPFADGNSGVAGPTRTDVGPDEIEDFGSMATVDGSVNGNPFSGLVLQGPVRTEVFGKVGHTTGTFNTEMLQLNLSGGGVMIRESPTLQSLGQTSIANTGDGRFRISSFFDIFTELSLDGGQNWIPSDSSTHVYLQPQAPDPIPEPATIVVWSGLALIGVGVTCWKRRKVAN